MKYQPPPRLVSSLMKIFYRLLYYRMAWTYDFVAWTVSLGLWRSWVRSVLPFTPGKRVLELGHGPGHLQVELHQEGEPGRFVCGLDRSPQMGRMAQRRLVKLGFEPALVNGQAQHLPFVSSGFDHVIATFPTDYISQTETLAEIKRVLAPGGEAIVLLGAWITGRRPYERAAAGLFRITGQAPRLDRQGLQPPPVIEGMSTRTEWIELGSSVVMVIRAKKEESQSWN